VATDALLQLQASVTKTATFSSTGVDTGVVTAAAGQNTGASFSPLWARVLYSAATNVSGANSVTFTLDGSTDNSNWGTIAGARPGDTVVLSTTAQAGEIFIPFVPRQRYVRLTATFTGAGSTPTITYQGDIAPGGPN